ncbi:hypothetical protein AURDEDRAFT_114346 [Auricularia subglabra TFB-10046 SS5]|nr:hypothetical protein AURDEDRAFT_114346 [Auricularia subglabra TFB-10046 SS5]
MPPSLYTFQQAYLAPRLPPITELVGRPGLPIAAPCHPHHHAHSGSGSPPSPGKERSRLSIGLFTSFKSKNKNKESSSRSPSPSGPSYPTSSAREDRSDVDMDTGLSPILTAGALFGGGIPVLKRSNSGGSTKSARSAKSRSPSPTPTSAQIKASCGPPLAPPRAPGLMGLSGPPPPFLHKPPLPKLERSSSLTSPTAVSPKPRRRLSLSALINPPLRKRQSKEVVVSSIEPAEEISRPASPADSMWTTRTTSTRPTTYAPSVRSAVSDPLWAASSVALDMCCDDDDREPERDRESSPSSSSQDPRTPAPLHTPLPSIISGGAKRDGAALSPKLLDLALGEPALPPPVRVYNSTINSAGTGWADPYAAATSYNPGGPMLNFATDSGFGGGGGGGSAGPLPSSRKREEDLPSLPPPHHQARRAQPPMPPMNMPGMSRDNFQFNPQPHQPNAFDGAPPTPTHQFGHQQQQHQQYPRMEFNMGGGHGSGMGINSGNGNGNGNFATFNPTPNPSYATGGQGQFGTMDFSTSTVGVGHGHGQLAFQPQQQHYNFNLSINLPLSLQMPHGFHSQHQQNQQNQQHHQQQQQQRVSSLHQHQHQQQYFNNSSSMQLPLPPLSAGGGNGMGFGTQTPSPFSAFDTSFSSHGSHLPDPLRRSASGHSDIFNAPTLPPPPPYSHTPPSPSLTTASSATLPTPLDMPSLPVPRVPKAEPTLLTPLPPPVVKKKAASGSSKKRKAPDYDDDEDFDEPEEPEADSDGSEYDPRAERRRNASTSMSARRTRKNPTPGAGPTFSVTVADRSGSEGATPSTGGSNKKLLECSYCQKRFERMSVLKTHLNCHTGAKPYVCTVPGCDATFGVLSNMYRHVRSHTTPRTASGGGGGAGGGAGARRKRGRQSAAASTASTTPASVSSGPGAETPASASSA